MRMNLPPIGRTNGYTVADAEVQEDFRNPYSRKPVSVRNTVRFDAAGLPSIPVKFEPGEEALLSYLYGDSTAGIHPAFNIDGVIKPLVPRKVFVRQGWINQLCSQPQGIGSCKHNHL